MLTAQAIALEKGSASWYVQTNHKADKGQDAQDQSTDPAAGEFPVAGLRNLRVPNPKAKVEAEQGVGKQDGHGTDDAEE